MAKKEDTMAPNKMGRPRINLVYDAHDRLIDGLSIDISTGTHFTRYKDKQGNTKKELFGNDRDTAIAKFRRWQAKRAGGDKVIYEKPEHTYSLAERTSYNLLPKVKADLKKQGVDPDKYLDDKLHNFIKEVDVVVKEVKIDEEDIWDYLRKLIEDNPVLAAQKLKIPALANVEYLKNLRKPYTLKEIGDNYFNKVEFKNAKGEQKHELDKVENAWDRFVSAVDVSNVTELTKDKIKLYYHNVYHEYVSKKYSTTWIKGYFERIKRIFHAAIRDLDYPSDINEALLRCKAVLKIPRHEIRIPAHKISRENFHLLLSNSTAEERCMWLLSMNLGYYTVDVADVPLSAIHLQTKTVKFRRGKTGIHRAGILWDETIEAIKAYQKERPHRGTTLFFNMQDKQPYANNRIRKKFVEVRNDCGLTMTHNNFRDSFESICSAKNIPQRSIDCVMGHKIIADKYTDPESTPEITAPACKAVWEYYFGGQFLKVWNHVYPQWFFTTANEPSVDNEPLTEGELKLASEISDYCERLFNRVANEQNEKGTIKLRPNPQHPPLRENYK